ncbi:MAG: hypothetical protein WKF30_12730 [Pyrinomonadaceae bacterium]
MQDWIGVAVFVGVIAIGLVVISQLGRGRAPISEEEFERRVQEGPGLLNAGVIGLQKILEPGAAKAEAVQQDMREGLYAGEQGSGEGDAPGAQRKSGGQSSEEKKGDA